MYIKNTQKILLKLFYQTKQTLSVCMNILNILLTMWSPVAVVDTKCHEGASKYVKDDFLILITNFIKGELT